MSRASSFNSIIRPVVTILTVLFFFGVISFGILTDKLDLDRALDVLSGIFGWTVGYFFAKRDQDKKNDTP